MAFIKCFFHFHWKKLGMYLRTFFGDILILGKKESLKVLGICCGYFYDRSLSTDGVEISSVD